MVFIAGFASGSAATVAIDPLRDEIAIIRSTFPELEAAKAHMKPEHWSFMMRNMALAYQLGERNTLAKLTPTVGQA